MESLIELLISINTSLLSLNIDLMIVLLVISGGFFQKKYWNTDTRLNSAFKTLIVATVFTAIYLLLSCDFESFETAKHCLKIAFISYCISTSFYEIIVKHTLIFIKSKFGKQ